jgi:hypothetical protein
MSLFDRNANYPRANHAEFASSPERHIDDPACPERRARAVIDAATD